MTRDEVRKIVEGITDEQLKSILDLHSAGIGKAKADGEKYKTELDTANKQIETITAELDGLKESNASAEDWKAKYEKFKATVDAEKAEAKKAQLEAEKRANMQNRFNAVIGDRKFSHPAIEADYFEKFIAEADKADGRGDNDIFTDLTKDDGQAFVGNTVTVTMAGAKPVGTQRMNRDDIMKIKDPVQRQNMIKQNIKRQTVHFLNSLPTM